MVKNIFFSTPNFCRYTLFTLLFQTGMAISLAAMPLYFKQENALAAYGMAYSAMAITGAFSFIYGLFVDKIGFGKALIFGTLLYGLALSLRVFTHPMIAIGVAIMAGVGASIGILAMRSWTLSLAHSDDRNSTELTAMRSMLINISTLMGTALVSGAAYVFVGVYFWLLLLAGGLVFLACIWAYQFYQNDPNTSLKVATQSKHPSPVLFKNISASVWPLVAAEFLAGGYTGLFKPYSILMFVDYGVSESYSVFIYLMVTALSIVVGMTVLKYNQTLRHYTFTGFFVSMGILLAVYGLMALTLSTKAALVFLVLLALLRGATLNLSSSFEQVMQYELFDKETLGMALGFTQTAFLAGDALGSLFTSLWIIPTQADDYAQVCLWCMALILLQTAIVVLLKRLVKQ